MFVRAYLRASTDEQDANPSPGTARGFGGGAGTDDRGDLRRE